MSYLKENMGKKSSLIKINKEKRCQCLNFL